MDNNVTRQTAEHKLQKALKEANRHNDNWSLHGQQKATELILNAKIDFNNTLSEVGDISKEEALQRNAELQYQLRINNNHSLKLGKAPATTVMADLYDAQMEYLDNMKKINTMRGEQKDLSSGNNQQKNNNDDDWRMALIQQYMDSGNANSASNNKNNP